MPYKNREAALKYWKSYNASPKGKDSQLRVRYGITLDNYFELSEAQGHVCAICGSEENDSRRKYFDVDHNHTTGQVRGLVCSRCNLMIGNIENHGQLVEKILSYLRSWESKNA